MSTLAASNKDLDVDVRWGPRPERAEALATRWLALIERLQKVDPLLADWMHWEDSRGLVPFRPTFEAQMARVIEGTERGSNGQVCPSAGTRLSLMVNPLPRPRHFTLRAYVGKDYAINQIIGDTDYYSVPDPALVTYDVMRGVMLAAAETFEATQARVYPTDLRRFWTDPRGIRPDLDVAWISYVAPRFAHLVAPPPSAIVEHRPDGGLLLAATTETFSTDNPDHLVAARDIKAALEPYNAVPWTPETGK